MYNNIHRKNIVTQNSKQLSLRKVLQKFTFFLISSFSTRKNIVKRKSDNFHQFSFQTFFITLPSEEMETLVTKKTLSVIEFPNLKINFF